MQITEQIIERISRKVFNTMFSPALRQSNVVMGGSGSSVSWADNAGHANEADTAGHATTADSASTAASASSVPWSGVADKPAYATRWPSWTEVTSKPTSKTIWGQTYLDASSNFQNVSGALSSVTNLTMSGKLKIGNIYIEAQTDYIEIYRLNDQNKKIGASLCAYGGVSALGVGTGGGGGGDTSLLAVWAAMGNATNEQINISHLATALTGYATQQWVGQQGYITASGSCNYATSAGNADNADKLDDQEATRFGWVYNSSEHGNSSSVTVNDLASAGGSNATFGMICSGTDNPTGAGKWVHVWSQQWTINTASSWVSQIAIGTQDKDGMWYRCTNSGGTIVGVAWKRVLDSSNSSVSKSGSTLTVKINGTEKSLENTWRGIQNNLTSDSTSDSLSAKQGKLLKGYVDTLNGYFDASGNAKSALKLTTVSKTAWGQTFWTSGGVPTSISGDLSSVGDISFSASGKNIGGVAYFDTVNKRLGVNQSSPSYTLDVNGGAAFAGDVLPAADYATTEYSLGSSSYRWDRLYARFVHLTGTAPAVNVGRTLNYNIALHWAADSKRGLYDYSKGWVIGTDGTNTFLMGGNVGIGTASPGDEKLKVEGSIYTTVGLYSEGYVDGLAYNTASDKRLKDIIDYDAVPHINDIANAPAIHFTWKNKRDKKIHVGSIAQYWQKITPECVHQSKRRFLTMNYDVIALVNTIALAREINALKHEITELKNKEQ